MLKIVAMVTYHAMKMTTTSLTIIGHLCHAKKL